MRPNPLSQMPAAPKFASHETSHRCFFVPPWPASRRRVPKAPPHREPIGCNTPLTGTPALCRARRSTWCARPRVSPWSKAEKRRGLAGALGNVLVDGRRPSAKDQTLEDILGRIPAAQVQHIEMLRGAEAASDPSGHAILLNVVRTPFTGQGFGSLGLRACPAGRTQTQWHPGVVRPRTHASTTHSAPTATASPANCPERVNSWTSMAIRTAPCSDVSPRDYGQYAINGEAASDAGWRPPAIHRQGFVFALSRRLRRGVL